MMVPSPPPLATNGETHAVIAGEWVLTGFCILIVAARLWVRKRLVKNVLSDDWVILVALLLQIACQILTTYNHLATLERDAAHPFFNPMSVKYAVIGIGPTFVTGALIRLSATIFLVRIFNTYAWLKYYLIGLTSLQAVCTTLFIIFFYLFATPIEFLWDPTIPGKVNVGLQHAGFYLSITISVLYALSDLTYVMFPAIIIVKKFKLSTARKCWLGFLMLLSLVMVAFSIARAIISLSTGIGNVKAVYKAFWVNMEQCLTIIITCIPSLLPITNVDHPVVNKIRDGFYGAVGELGRKLGSPRGSAGSPPRPSFVRSVTDRVRQASGARTVTDHHSLASVEEEGTRLGALNCGQTTSKSYPETWTSEAPSTSCNSNHTNTA